MDEFMPYYAEVEPKKFFEKSTLPECGHWKKTIVYKDVNLAKTIFCHDTQSDTLDDC